MIKERDYQKKKLYSAEDSVMPLFGELDLNAKEKVKNYVYLITESKWWKEKYTGLPVVVTFANIRGARTNIDTANLRFSEDYDKFIYNKMTVIHELAHLLLPNMGVATINHTPEFAWLMLIMVRRYLGDAIANKLEDTFINSCVKYSSAKYAYKRARFKN